MPDAGKDFSHRIIRDSKRNHELVLQEAALAIHAIPLMNGVERIEEWIIGNGFVDLFTQLDMIIQFIERFDSERVQDEGGEVERQSQWQALFHRLCGQFARRIVVAAHEYAPAQIIATDQDIDPGHSVLVILVRFGRDGKKFVKRGETDMVHVYVWVDDGLQLNFGPQDDAGETEATDGRLEKLTICVWRTDKALAVGAQ